MTLVHDSKSEAPTDRTQPQVKPVVASDALSFLVFGLVNFDNPMFTEDAVHALMALLREGTAAQVLAHRASLPLLEALNTASSFLPRRAFALGGCFMSPSARVAAHGTRAPDDTDLF